MKKELEPLFRAAWLEVEGKPRKGYEDFREQLMEELAPVFEKFADLIMARLGYEPINEAIPGVIHPISTAEQ